MACFTDTNELLGVFFPFMLPNAQEIHLIITRAREAAETTLQAGRLLLRLGRRFSIVKV